MISKATLIACCLDEVDGRIREVGKQLSLLQDALGSDTKSSAGDKHETSREMSAQEMSKLDASLSNLQRMRADLARIDPTSKHQRVAFGSVVQTDQNTFLIAAPLGAVSCEGKPAMAISMAAPLAQQLLGKAEGSTITLNDLQHCIRTIN